MPGTSDEIRKEILSRLYDQRNTEEGKEAEPEKATVTSGKDIGATLSYNDVFTLPAEKGGLPNFTLDGYEALVETVGATQGHLIPDLDPNYKEQTEVLWVLVYCMVNDELALLQGMQGTGKTSGLEYVCAKMQVPLMRINCSSTQDSSAIAGSIQVVREEGVPITKYVGDTDFMINMQKGVVCLLDEIFWAPDDLRGGTLMRFRDKPADGGPRILTAPEDTSGSVGKPVHPMSRLFYADNTLGLGDNADKFAARFVADTAFLDGINYVIKVDYLPLEDEVDLLLAWAPDLDADLAKKLVQLGTLARSAFDNGDLPVTISPRTLKAVAHSTVSIGNPMIALKFGYYNKLSEDSERDCFKSLIGTVGFPAKYGTIKDGK